MLTFVLNTAQTKDLSFKETDAEGKKDAKLSSYAATGGQYRV